ncbi:GNAT family N-acetyltransferase [Leifsonia aquatica]|uniref:GNAT family N-acetyltransferase n=1 Tax=Leifsonia aquatica TaxID=144185 RepID=UPI0028AF6E6A|nr:GNAT family N-acetyltransferase [Leifsonia aquatica]
MVSTFTIRKPVAEDAAAMARLHVQSWQETYRGTVPDDVLDDAEFVARRDRMWTALITDPRYSTTIAVAERAGELIGLASSGPSMGEHLEPALQLYTLYVLTAHHGSGAGAALLEAVLNENPAQLWVADPNPRAQAFYLKHGFDFDGTTQMDDGIRELRMVRSSAS